MDFKDRVKQLREEYGLTQKELAKRLNVARSNISKYETGFLEANTETLIRLAEVFNCSINYLLGVDEDRNAEPNKLAEELKEYKKAVVMAKEAGITPNDLEELLPLLHRLAHKKD